MPVLIAGEAGIGKSHFVYWLACALAQGGDFLGWKATEPISVGILDGEMRDSTIRTRVAAICESTHFDGENLTILTRDIFTRAGDIVPTLREADVQKKILSRFSDVKVLFIDNVNNFFSGGNENASEFWDDVERLVLLCRDHGIAPVVVHHAPKSNNSRPAGNSKNERLPEVVIVLNESENACNVPGVHIRVHFKKSRGLLDTARIFEATLKQYEDKIWRWSVHEDARFSRHKEVIGPQGES